MSARGADARPRVWAAEVAGAADALVSSLRGLARGRFEVEAVAGSTLVLRDRERSVCSRIQVEVVAHGAGARVQVRDVGVPLTGRELSALVLVGICLLAGVRMIGAGVMHGYWMVPLAVFGGVLLVVDRIGALRRRGQDLAAVTQVVGAAIREVLRGTIADAYRGLPEVTGGGR